MASFVQGQKYNDSKREVPGAHWSRSCVKLDAIHVSLTTCSLGGTDGDGHSFLEIQGGSCGVAWVVRRTQTGFVD